MKNIQIVIIPGHNDNIRHITINIFLFIGIIMVLVLLLSFSTVFIIQNFRATKHISQISALKEKMPDSENTNPILKNATNN